MSSRRAFGTILAVCASISLAGITPVAQAAFECDDSSGVCIEAGGSWQANALTNAKERKRRTMKTAGTLSLRIEGGRGSVFINGRYRGTAPLEGIKVPSGKSDVQVRDGSDVLAKGVLTVPKGSDVVAVVRYQ